MPDTAPPASQILSDRARGLSLERASASFRRYLEATNKSPRTVETYGDALDLFRRFLTEKGMPQTLDGIKREHIEAWIAALLKRAKPATANNRYRALASFLRWAISEDEIKSSPMERMRPPTIPETPPRVLSAEEVSRLIRACSGTDFDSRRDTALLAFLADTGARRAEASNLAIEDVDLDRRVAWVMGKGRRPRAVPFGRKTAQYLDRYMRLRERHAHAHDLLARGAGQDEETVHPLWLGRKGRLRDNSILQIVRKRGQQAGIADLHTHSMRHAWAHSMLSSGMGESDVMHLAGWRTTEMVRRYASSTAGQRARDAYESRAPLDRIT
jgi:site-specific recombinase XerD